MNYLQISPFIGYTNSIVWGAYLGILLWAGLVFIILFAICCWMSCINAPNVKTQTFDDQIQLLSNDDDDQNARSKLNASQNRIVRNICIDVLIMLMFLIVYYLLILLSGWELLDEPYSTLLFFLALVGEFQLHWYRIGAKYYEKVSYKMPVDLTQSDEQCITTTRAELNQRNVNMGKLQDKKNSCQEANNQEKKKFKRKIEQMREKLFAVYILYSFAIGYYGFNVLKYHCPSGEFKEENDEFSYAIQANQSIVASYLIKNVKEDYPQFDVKIENSIGNNLFFAQNSVMAYKDTNINVYQAGISEEVLVDQYTITFQSYGGASIVHKPINEIVEIAIISNLFDLGAINARDFKHYDFLIFTGNFAQDLGKQCCMNRQQRFLKKFQSIPIMVVPGLLENGEYNNPTKFPHQLLYQNTFHPNNNTVSYNPNSYQIIFNTTIQIVTDLNQNITHQNNITQLIIIVPFSIHCNIDKFNEWYDKQNIGMNLNVKLVESGQLEYRESVYLDKPNNRNISIMGGGRIGENIYKVKQDCQDNNKYINNISEQGYINLKLGQYKNNNIDNDTNTTMIYQRYIKSS